MEGARDRARGLADRLRRLRDDAGLTQRQLADALSVSVPLISSWESRKNSTIPPEDRVASYARLFATPRSVDGDQVRLVVELTDAEERARAELEQELQDLRAAAIGEDRPAELRNEPPSAGLWHFADGAPVTIVCGKMPEDHLKANAVYIEPGSPDYIELYRFADLDALIELHGHVRAANPNSQVTFHEASLVNRDVLTAHLVLLGGVDWNAYVAEVLETLKVPVQQKERTHLNEPGAFEVKGTGKAFSPRLGRSGSAETLVEDVGLFCRGRNPYNQFRTVTICNGQYGRGTYGVVRALTDQRFRDRNARYVRSRFAHVETYSFLTRVKVVLGDVITPDWTQPDNILHEWSAR